MSSSRSEDPIPRIAAVSGGAPRPRWSVVIPTYNPTRRLAETLADVRAQDPGPAEMQIVITDDASRDDTGTRIVREILGSRADVHRHAGRLGIGGNWNAGVALSRGHFVHLLHQDDRVLPGFYETLGGALEANPSLGAAFCRNWLVDAAGERTALSAVERESAGVLDGWLDRIAVSNRVQCPAIAVRRDVYEELGGFRSDLCFTLDWEMWVRIAAHRDVHYEPEPLAAFRVHEGMESYRLCASGENMADLRRALAIVASHVPRERRGEVLRRSRRQCVAHALGWARRMLRGGHRAAALVQLREAIATDPSLRLDPRVWNLYRHSAQLWLRGVLAGDRA